MMKVKAGIYGGAGYTAGELLRILLNHPYVEVTCVQSESQADKSLIEVHTDLVGETDLKFSKHLVVEDLDVLFLCKGHGESIGFYNHHKDSLTSVVVIDLSQDFRPRANDEGFVYGLPELNESAIRKSQRIANPGCFATCIQLGLLPAVSHQLVDGSIHVSGITGSTGAGQKLAATSHFSWRDSNMSVYKAFEHQHLLEVKESLLQEDERFNEDVHFIPYRGNFTRGIITTCYFPCDAELSVVKSFYKHYYETSPFVHVIDQNPNLKQVVNTNKVLIYLERHGEQLMVIAVIDNLLKGASGQAVQNMNIVFDWEQSIGLKLKANAF